MTGPIPGVLDFGELEAFRAEFGVAEIQVRRDHLISHALAAIASLGSDEIVFFGGTALCRTHLPHHRLSEDIDLIALTDRPGIAARIEAVITRALRRTLGLPTFIPPLRRTGHAEPSVLEVAGLRVQIQLLDHIGYPPWPSAPTSITQRYSDAPPAELRVFTPPAFAASKLAAWHDRYTSRDLYDLWAMAESGMVDDEARALFTRLGPLTNTAAVRFDRYPDEETWQAELRPQCVPQVTARRAAEIAATAWR